MLISSLVGVVSNFLCQVVSGVLIAVLADKIINAKHRR